MDDSLKIIGSTHQSNLNLPIGNTRTEPTAEELAKDFLYRFVLPAMDYRGRNIWELNLNSQILTEYFRNSLGLK